MKNGPNKVSRRWLPVVAILTLSGCSDIGLDGLFGDDTPPPQTATEQNLRDRADAQQTAAEDSDTPSLTSVPNRPTVGSSAVRDRVVEGLTSDRDDARYADEFVRLQGSTRSTPASQAASVPQPATPPAAPAAPETPAPVTAQIAVTPPPTPATPVTSVAAPTPPPSAPVARTETPSPAPTQTAQIKQPLPPTSSSVQIRQSLPQARASNSSQSVVVDMSTLDGGDYAPVSAQISREAQVATIQFGRSSSRLGSRDLQLINAVALVQRQGGENVLVVGHASSRTVQLPKTKHEVTNFQVSFARANAVAQALIRAGVSSDRVTVEAVSDDQPIYSEAMPTGEAGNRRAEIYFLQ